MDYKAFLKPTDPVVLPYFGGTRVDAATRRFAVSPRHPGEAGMPPLGTQLAPGWWRFQIDHRRAVPLEPASPVALESLPVMRGHWVDGWVVFDGRTLGRIALPPDDEPPALSRVVARRWYSEDLLFDTIEFEDDAEISARQALEERRPLGDIKGVVPSLRAAFGYALGMTVARELGFAMTPRELTPRVVAIADGGREVVVPLFTAMIAQREAEAAESRRRAQEAEAAARLAGAVKGAKLITRTRDPRRRVDEVLEAARARMINCRVIDRGSQLDVVYEVDGTRIMSLVQADTLQVIDPGICLSGAHRVLTLDAMPSVVREAIEEDHLNITRRQ